MGKHISIRRTICSKRGLRVSGSFWLLIAVSLLVAPPDTLLAVLLAAAMHEGGHALALRAYGVTVEGLRLSASGAVLYASGARRLSYGRELAVTLAGPAVNLAAAPLLAVCAARYGWAWGYLFAGAHLILGVYNLLPIPPLDGAHALELLLCWRWGPPWGELISAAVGLLSALFLVLLAVRIIRSGVLFLFAAIGLLRGAYDRVRILYGVPDVLQSKRFKRRYHFPPPPAGETWNTPKPQDIGVRNT